MAKKKVSRKVRGNRKRAVGYTLLVTVMLFIGVYTGIEDPDKVVEGVYELDNFNITVETDTGYSGKVLDNPKLTVYGDKGKVTKMRKSGEIPKVAVALKGKKSGEYTVEPKVTDTKFGVNYKFVPESITVKIEEAVQVDKNIYEHGYGLTAEGYKVASIVAKEKAQVIATKEQEQLIGQIVVEVDVTGLKETTELDGTVYILDKRGNLLEDIEVVNSTIPMTVNIEPMPWLATEHAIAEHEKELKKLEGELKGLQEELKTITDVLQQKDINREIQFRETRIKDLTEDLLTKQKNIVGQKEIQEEKKKQDVKESVIKGGKVVEED